MTKKEFKDKMLLITYAIILFVALTNYTKLTNILLYTYNIISPFITGIIMAFVLNVLVDMYEEKLFFKFPKQKRALGVLSALITVIALFIFILLILIPQIKNAGSIFINNLPKYQENINLIGEKIGLSDTTLEIIDLDNDSFKKAFAALISENSSSIIKYSMGFANSLIGAATNAFVGIVFCIYILLDKDDLKRQFNILLKKLCSEKVHKKLVKVGSLSSTIFGDFIKVQCLEACILGVLCFIGMLILGLPYAATISVLVGFTALIPIFGAFIGCIIGAFLIFMINPVESVIFIIFFLILQQIEGNFIYPKVVGGKIGLPSIWVLVAVIIGGAVGGILGMLLGVPLVSVIYSLLKIYVNDDKRNKQQIKVGEKNDKKVTN